MKNRWMRIVWGVGLICLSLTGCQNAKVVEVTKRPMLQSSGSFKSYVTLIDLGDSRFGRIPGLEVLPDDVYEDALWLAGHDVDEFNELVCLLLLEYDLYYRENFNQGYSLVGPREIGRIDRDDTSNNKFFVLHAFLRLSGYTVSPENDGFPSRSAVWYCEKHYRGRIAFSGILQRIEKAQTP